MDEGKEEISDTQRLDVVPITMHRMCARIMAIILIYNPICAVIVTVLAAAASGVVVVVVVGILLC